MAIQKGNLIKLHAALLQTPLTKPLKPHTSDGFPSIHMQKPIESTRITCQQQSPVAVPMVLLFGQFTTSTDVISYIINTRP